MRPLLLLLPLLLAACPAPSDDGADTDSDTTADTVIDSDGGDTDTEVPTLNHAPGAPEVAVGPEDATTSTGLEATIVTESVDPDGDLVTYTWVWRVDGNLRLDVTTPTVAPGVARRGEVWEVQAVPHDDQTDGEAGAASITIGNATPALATAWNVPTPNDDDELRVRVTTSDADADLLALTYVWTKDGAPTAFGTSTVPAAYTEPGQHWEVTVTVDDGHGGQVTETLVVDIANRAPSISALTIAPSPASPGVPLVATVVAADADHDPLTTTWVWKKGSAITAYHADTIPLGVTVAGETWTATATVSDGRGASATASVSVSIVDQPPEASVTLPEIASPGVELTAYVDAVDPEGETLLISYTWTVDGLPYPATGPTIPAGVTLEGETWEVTVTVDDGHGHAIVRTASTYVENQTPTVWSVTLRPFVPDDADDLRAIVVADDPEGDPLTLTYTWTRNFFVTAHTGATVPAADTAVGDIWQVKVSASDGHTTSGEVWAQSVTIAP